MPRENFEVVGSFNNQRIGELDSERTINMFEFIDPEGKKPRALFPTPGIVTQFSLLEVGGIRAMFVYGAFLYVVVDSHVYKVDSAFVATNIGTMTTSAGYVGIDANTFQIIFVDGQNGYIYDTNIGLFTTITDSNFPPRPIDVTALDNFFIVANGQTSTFYVSENNQGLVWGLLKTDFTIAAPPTDTLILTTPTVYQTGTPVTVSVTGGTLPAPLVAGTIYYAIFVDATHIKLSLTPNGTPIIMTTTGSGTFTVTNNGQLQTANITTHPGNIVACRTLHRRLFLFAGTYTEIWENAGSANFPFRRNNAFLIELGTVNASSIKTGFDRMFFLSQDRDGLGSVMMVSGVQAIPISNSALDFQLQNFNNPANCDVALYRENGIIFYRLNFTADNHTYVYNVSMSTPQKPLWHEEQMLNGNRSVMGVNANFNGSNYFGDYSKPTVYYSDDSIFTNDGEAIPRIRITRDYVRPDYRGFRINRMQLDLLQGNVEDQAINDAPIVFMSVSKDGGVTYGAKLPALMGKLGERKARTVWRKVATFRRGQGMVLKFECYNKIKFAVFGAAWDYLELQE